MSITTAQGRVYEIDGKSYPSVTTILSMLAKPQLMPWAVKMTTESFECQMMQYYNPEECVFVVPDVALPSMLDKAKKAHRQKSSDAMQHGTRVHEAIAHYIDAQGKCVRSDVQEYIASVFHGTDTEIEAAMVGFDAFISWADANDLHIVSSEQVVTDNFTYAGRYDLVAQLNGKLVLIDIKTSTGIWDEYWLQCAAYANAGFAELPDAIGVLRIDKVTGEIEYQERTDYHHEIEAFNMLALAYGHLQALKPQPKERKKK